jgi:hypothetical protein
MSIWEKKSDHKIVKKKPTLDHKIMKRHKNYYNFPFFFFYNGKASLKQACQHLSI